MSKELTPGSITVETAREMVEAFTTFSETQASDCYTKAVWFSLAQIEGIYNTIKQQGGDGVRLYYAQYTKNTIGEMPDAYNGRNTLIFVPTKASKGMGDPIHEDDLDVDPVNQGSLCPQECSGTSL
ncbi:hypothetical protein [Pedobacter sp. MW01-1-1]|uniref:hypothetical protein n=1 Tax=Pedobacter sp. MW01-1-1 TaxID=3383027 RepID=UPI003FEF6C61